MKLKQILLFVISFFLLWTGAWILHNLLTETIWQALEDSENHNMLYWAVMKTCIWIIFPFFYAKQIFKLHVIKKFFGIQNLKKGIIFGVIASIIWIISSYFVESMKASQVIFSFATSFTFFWVITGTPIAEEFTFRGVIQPALQKSGISFWYVNIITSIVFLLMHCLGWAFQGVLQNNLFSISAISILLVSLIAGWLRHKSDSLYSSIIFHSVNNFFASIIS
ncbi:MAG: type II CAAX endopeptidase family protein [Patescibacteria group bacterium]